MLTAEDTSSTSLTESTRETPRRTPRASFEWRYLAFLNWPIDPALAAPHVGPGLEPDTYGGNAWLSLVPLIFRNPTLLRVPIPWFRDVGQVQLRLTVRPRNRPYESGFLFLQNTLPSALGAFLLRALYHEQVQTGPVQRHLGIRARAIDVDYRWRTHGHWNFVRGLASGDTEWAKAGSLEEFLCQRPFLYARRTSHSLLRFHLETPPWVLRPFTRVKLSSGDPQFVSQPWNQILSRPPAHAFLAEGSPVALHGPVPILSSETGPS